MTDIVQHNGSNELAADMAYAKVVSSGAMLPAQYRGKPADILIAMGLGRAMGLSPAESLYRIHVIQGRPTASAELIAANVRKAGHILRVKGDETSARAVIIRSDDPDFEFESTWNLDRAKRLGLASKDGWQKQPGTMMRWRAITEVARLACPEALYGVAYVAEEIDDAPRQSAPARVAADDFLPQSQPAEHVVPDDVEPVTAPPGEDVQDADVVDEPVDPRLTRRMFAAFTAAGFTEDARSEAGRTRRLTYISQIVGRDIASSKELTGPEVAEVVDALEQDAQEQQ
jgi:hypothetical protein